MHHPLEDNIISLYNYISAWYTAWNKDKHVINNDNTLKIINNLWKAFHKACAELNWNKPSHSKIIRNYFVHCENKYQSMHNEYISRGTHD